MDTFIYVLLLIILIGLALTMFGFIKSLASFASLINAANVVAVDTPWWKLLISGGTIPLWKVLAQKENARARAVLIKSSAIFFLSFGATMGAGILLINLNSKHCVFSMTETASDGTTVIVCPSE